MSSSENVCDLKNQYEGERIFILGNGPSISETPLAKFESEYTLAFNNIGEIYSDTEWRPSFYYNFQGPNNRFAPDDLDIVLENVRNDSICFLSPRWSDVIEQGKNVYYLRKWGLHHTPFHEMTRQDIKEYRIDYLMNFWSDHISNFVYQYHSMYGGIQVAAYLGFDEIYFVGCDLGMEYKNPHMIFKTGLDPHRYHKGVSSYIKESIEKDCLIESIFNGVAMKVIKLSYNSNYLTNFLSVLFETATDEHFTKNYLHNIVIADRETNSKEIERSHLLSKRICEYKRINMYNATIGGDLEVYERVNLNSVL